LFNDATALAGYATMMMMMMMMTMIEVEIKILALRTSRNVQSRHTLPFLMRSGTTSTSEPLCCKSARHRLTALPQQLHADGCGVGQPLRFECMQAITANRHCYRLHYPRRPAQYIASVKPARSDATWRLVYAEAG